MANSLTVGYIGLGLMGKSIARNILKAGFTLVVHNRSQQAVRELVSEGAKAAASPAETASQVDIVFTNLPDTPDVLDVVLGSGGIIESARPDLVYVDNSTIKPGAGQIAKAANQIMVAAQMVALGELLVFAQKAGADPVKVVEAIRGGAAQCWTLDVKPERLFSGNRAPGFKAYMQAKDLAIILETAREYGIPLPSAALDAQLFNAMVEMGMGELDNSGVIGVIEMLAGARLKEG